MSYVPKSLKGLKRQTFHWRQPFYRPSWLVRFLGRSVFSVSLCGLLVVSLSPPVAWGETVSQPSLRALNMSLSPRLKGASQKQSTNPTQKLQLAVSLPYADPTGIQNYVNSVSDPTSPLYRHFLTPAQIGAQFGLPTSAVDQVKNYLTSNGMNVTLVAKNHLDILVTATVKQAEAAFHTPIDTYTLTDLNTHASTKKYSNTATPQLPSTIAAYVTSIVGLDNLETPQIDSLTPQQERTLYDLAPLYNAGYQGQGRTVGVSNFDTYQLTNLPLYYTQYNLPAPTGGVGSNVTVETVDGGPGSGGAGDGSAEGNLDIQSVLGAAPLTNLIIYDCANYIGCITQESNDDSADIITDSYGESLAGFLAEDAHDIHLSMSAEGITYMNASGDTGTTLTYPYANTDPEILTVGGTTPSTDGSGNRISEAGWSGSGGGWSTNAYSFNTLPSWQVGTGVPTDINYRLSPDVAGNSAGSYAYVNGSLAAYGGTSASTPLFAGSLAVAEQRIISAGGLPPDANGHQRYGRIQDLLYSMNGRSDVFYDITSGSNGTLPDSSTSNAGTGWDFVTGWGAIDFNGFVTSQTTDQPDFSMSATPSSQTVNANTVNTYTATVSPLNGFTGSVGLSVSGLPANTSASFSPTSIAGGSGSSVLTVTTTATTPNSTSTLTISGTSTSFTHNTSVSLTVTNAIGPTPGCATTLPIIQAVGGNQLSVLYSGTRYPIDSLATVNAWGLSCQTVNTVSSSDYNSYPVGQPITQVVENADGPEVYIMQGGAKRHIRTSLYVHQVGLDNEEVTSLPSGLLANIPEGVPMGFLVKASNSSKIFLSQANDLYYVPNIPTIESWGFPISELITVDPAYVNAMPIVGTLSTLAKGSGLDIYVASLEKLVYAPSTARLRDWDMQNIPVTILDNSFLQSLPENGALSRVTRGDGPDTYYIANDQRWYIRSLNTLNTLISRYGPTTYMADTEIASIPYAGIMP